MGYKLFIAEKRKVGQLIAAALANLDGQPPEKEANNHIRGRGWIVAWLAGHTYTLYDLKDYKKEEWTLGWQNLQLPIIPDKFQFKPIEADHVARLIQTNQQLLKGADSVVIATDAGQEGQIIAEIFLQQQGWNGPIERLWTSANEIGEMTRAVQHLESNTLQKYQGLKQSGMTRLYGDWTLGINFTIAYTRLAEKAGYRMVASVGRVLSTLLSICVDHDEMVNSFSSTGYYDLEANLETPTGERFKAKLNIPQQLLSDGKHCRDEATLESIQAAVKQAPMTVSSIAVTQHSYNPPTPYNLTTLCIQLSRDLNLTSSQILELYQAMYESGYLTYPRTEDEYYADEQLTNVPVIFDMLRGVTEEFRTLVDGADLTKKPDCFNSSLIVEHPANSPTVAPPKWSSLCENSKRIYSAVARRMIAQFYPAHVISTSNITIAANGGYTFSAHSKTILQEGWTRVTKLGDDDDIPELPLLQEEIDLKIVDLTLNKKSTRAPARMNESKLLSIMQDCTAYIKSPQVKQRLGEKASLGTVATRGEHIEALINKRKYLSRNPDGSITPTKAGKQIRAILPPELSSPDITALWEISFKQIRAGSMDATDFEQKLKAWIASHVNKVSSLKLNPNPLAHFCRSCDSVMVRTKPKSADSSPSWRCTSCGEFTPDLNGKPVEPLEKHGTPCTQCGELLRTILRKRTLSNLKEKKQRAHKNDDRRLLVCKNGHFGH